MDTEPNWRDSQTINKMLLRTDISVKESQDLYTQWAAVGTYDLIHGSDPKKYRALDQLAGAVTSVIPKPGDQLVLDIGAGTGLTCQKLLSIGFTTIDCLEPHSDFVKVCNDKKTYRKIFRDFIGADKPLAISDDTYDLIVTSEAFGPGHIPCSAIPEMVRILKPGGYMVNCMREEYLRTVPEYRERLEPLMDQLVAEGKWKKIKWEKYSDHWVNKTGLVMIFQVC